MSEPPAKRIKLSDEKSQADSGPDAEDLMDQYFDELDQVQEAIENTIEVEAARIAQIQQEYAQKRKPLFEERSRIIRQMPSFWLKAVRCFPTLLLGEVSFAPKLSCAIVGQISVFLPNAQR